MNKTLTEMPKVGDELRYVGVSDAYMTKDKIYVVRGIYEDCAEILNDYGEIWNIDEDINDNFVDYEFVTESSPSTHDLLANLGRRLSEVEAKLERAKERKYYNDMVEAYADLDDEPEVVEGATSGLSSLYPKYYKDVTGVDSIDVYMTHELFQIDDPSGAIQHASKKLLLSGVRTGGKSKYNDIKEARDTLNRWLEINVEEATE